MFQGLDFIKRHPYFSQIEWNQMRYMHPPYVPKIQNAEDIRYGISEHSRDYIEFQ